MSDSGKSTFSFLDLLLGPTRIKAIRDLRKQDEAYFDGRKRDHRAQMDSCRAKYADRIATLKKEIEAI